MNAPFLAALTVTFGGITLVAYLFARFQQGLREQYQRDISARVTQATLRAMIEGQQEAAADLARAALGPPHLVHIRGTEDWALEWAEHVVPDGRYGPVIYTPASDREERVVRQVLASRFLELRPAHRPRTQWLARDRAAADHAAVVRAFARQNYVVRTIGSPKTLPPPR